MSLKQAAKKPWDTSESGPFGTSVALWGSFVILVSVASVFAVVLADTAITTYDLPAFFVDFIIWMLNYAPPILVLLGVVSFGLASYREIRFWSRKYRSAGGQNQ